MFSPLMHLAYRVISKMIFANFLDLLIHFLAIIIKTLYGKQAAYSEFYIFFLTFLKPDSIV